MSRIYCSLMATILLLALTARAETMPPSPVMSGIPAAAGNGAMVHALEMLGRWHEP